MVNIFFFFFIGCRLSGGAIGVVGVSMCVREASTRGEKMRLL